MKKKRKAHAKRVEINKGMDILESCINQLTDKFQGKESRVQFYRDCWVVQGVKSMSKLYLGVSVLFDDWESIREFGNG